MSVSIFDAWLFWNIIKVQQLKLLAWNKIKLLTWQAATYSLKITAVLKGFYISALWQNFYMVPALLATQKTHTKTIFIMYNAAFVVPPHILLSLNFEHFVDSSTEKDKVSYMCLPQKMWLSVSMLLPWPLPSTDFSHTTKAPRNPVASVWKSNREWWPNNQQAAAVYMVLPCKHPMGDWQNCNSKSLHLKIYYFFKII